MSAIIKTTSGFRQEGGPAILDGTTVLGDADQVLGPAAAGQTATARPSRLMQMTATGAHAVRLPLESECEGMQLWFAELGGNPVTLQSSAGAPIATIGTGVNNPTNQTVLLHCDGGAWRSVLTEA